VITIHQRHRQTDRQTTCDGNTALCTKVHRAVNSVGDTSKVTINDYSVVCLSVCLFVSLSVTFMHYAQTAEDIDTISSAYDSPMSLLDRVKICLLFLSKFCPKTPHSC